MRIRVTRGGVGRLERSRALEGDWLNYFAKIHF